MTSQTPARTQPDHDEAPTAGHVETQRILSTTDPVNGLTAAEVAARVADGRANRLANASSRSLLSILRVNLFTLFNLVIAVCTVVLLVLGRWQDALFSFAAIANGMIDATQQPRERLCTACFTGTYPIELPVDDRLGKNLLERLDPADRSGAVGCDPGPDAEFEAVLTADDKKERV